nr:MAG TPA: hypothetical protein [Caudoviricetes sp.]
MRTRSRCLGRSPETPRLRRGRTWPGLNIRPASPTCSSWRR